MKAPGIPGWHLDRRYEAVAEFLDWLINMDEPGSFRGAEDRRTVTLTKIIDRARAVQRAVED